MSNPDHTRTIITDLDDTISFTFNRDFDNAMPNKPLINKLNKLYDEGWTIIILTARGNISCKTREEADKKYRKQIETWLNKHNVKYSELSFDKKLSVIYIDDKAIRPEEFIEKFEQQSLKGGLSDATIVHDHFTNSVLKTANNTKSVVEWFEYVKEHNICNIPKINSVIGSTINMQYIEHRPEKFDIVTVMEILQSFRYIKPIHSVPTTEDKIEKYTRRCLSRMTDEITEIEREKIERLLRDTICATEVSFSHGDFSVSNILVDKDGKHYLIDPINDETLLSSWQLDLSKLHLTIETDIKKLSPFVIIHQIGHLCRMLPYSRNLNQEIYQKQKNRLTERLSYVL